MSFEPESNRKPKNSISHGTIAARNEQYFYLFIFNFSLWNFNYLRDKSKYEGLAIRHFWSLTIRQKACQKLKSDVVYTEAN